MDNNFFSILPILAAAIIVPIFLYKWFFPWLKRGGKGSYKAAWIIIILNLGIYGYWAFKVINDINQSQQLLLVSLPVLIVLIVELILLAMKNYQFLNKLCVSFLIVTLPWALLIISNRNYGPGINSETAIILALCSFFVQGFLYFPTFALYKKVNPNAPASFNIKLEAIDELINGKDFKKSEQYQHLKKAGMQTVSPIQLVKLILKYLLIIFLFWLYVSLIAP